MSGCGARLPFIALPASVLGLLLALGFEPRMHQPPILSRAEAPPNRRPHLDHLPPRGAGEVRSPARIVRDALFQPAAAEETHIGSGFLEGHFPLVPVAQEILRIKLERWSFLRGHLHAASLMRSFDVRLEDGQDERPERRPFHRGQHLQPSPERRRHVFYEHRLMVSHTTRNIRHVYGIVKCD